MTNQLYILICVMLLATSWVLLAACLSERRGSHKRRYALFYLILMAWQALELSFFVFHGRRSLQMICDLEPGLVAFWAVLFFSIMSDFYRIRHRFPRKLVPALCALPAATVLLALVPRAGGGLLSRQFAVLQLEPTATVSISRGVWFYLSVLYSLALLGVVVAAAVARYRHLPHAYWGSARLLAAGVVAVGAGLWLDLAAAPLKQSVSFTLVAATVAGMLFFVAIVRNGRGDYLQIRRQNIFDYLDPAVFVLSPDGRVLDMNRQARAWLDLLGEKADDVVFDAFMEGLYAKEKILHKPPEGEGEPTGEVFFANAHYPLIYRMRRQEMLGEDARPNGSIVAMEDVTRNRLFIERLQSMAGVDAMTGLYNRYGYQHLLRRLDAAENLPLCVVMGDVNGLKRINDTYGHQQGDRFLKEVARAIQAGCDDRCHVARVGGDEFIIVSTHCDETGGARIIQKINAALAAVSSLPEPPSVAFGLAVKTMTSQNINSLVGRADMHMYTAKTAEL